VSNSLPIEQWTGTAGAELRIGFDDGSELGPAPFYCSTRMNGAQ